MGLIDRKEANYLIWIEVWGICQGSTSGMVFSERGFCF